MVGYRAVRFNSLEETIGLIQSEVLWDEKARSYIELRHKCAIVRALNTRIVRRTSLTRSLVDLNTAHLAL
ncbi:unnamed protein product [Leptosia nina]|uniref:Uncharacterized protein n=1 Tax=Leptosia nina TaxID=320188 RepID=A0AAV1JPT5_9NEOP